VLGFVAGGGLAWLLAEYIFHEVYRIDLARSLPMLQFYIGVAVRLTLVGVTSGLTIGLIWHRAEPIVRWKQVLIATGGWAVGMLLGTLVAALNSITSPEMARLGTDYTLIGAIAGAVGSGVMAWQLRRVHRGG
jgi:hypothetical protein